MYAADVVMLLPSTMGIKDVPGAMRPIHLVIWRFWEQAYLAASYPNTEYTCAFNLLLLFVFLKKK